MVTPWFHQLTLDVTHCNNQDTRGTACTFHINHVLKIPDGFIHLLCHGEKRSDLDARKRIYRMMYFILKKQKLVNGTAQFPDCITDVIRSLCPNDLKQHDEIHKKVTTVVSLHDLAKATWPKCNAKCK
uniref:Uncharacterized protein n=1 Tax=Strigamia maritima TaxID=126957 RepID=T1IRM6_STRMM